MSVEIHMQPRIALAGLVPAIHAFQMESQSWLQNVDARLKAGQGRLRMAHRLIALNLALLQSLNRTAVGPGPAMT
jgi:hypothetical protein